jgi:hypothetical protein
VKFDDCKVVPVVKFGQFCDSFWEEKECGRPLGIKFGPDKIKLHGLSPRANYTDRATADCRRSDCQLLRLEGATWSA